MVVVGLTYQQFQNTNDVGQASRLLHTVCVVLHHFRRSLQSAATVYTVPQMAGLEKVDC